MNIIVFDNIKDTSSLTAEGTRVYKYFAFGDFIEDIPLLMP